MMIGVASTAVRALLRPSLGFAKVGRGVQEPLKPKKEPAEAGSKSVAHEESTSL